MILSDGKHVQGIFVYNQDIEYERGDFIVEGDCIYICKSGNPVKGVAPSTSPEFYAPYPGNMVASVEDYENYISSPEGKEDKYVSSNVLMGILQGMYFGFGDTGIIDSFIDYSDGDYNIDTMLLTIIKKRTEVIEYPLNILMTEPSVNNAYVRVDRNLPDIKYLLVENTVNNFGCLLRQYTYRDKNLLGEFDSNENYTEYRFRVQELIDLDNKIVYYRTTRGSKLLSGDTWQYDEPIGEWACSTVSENLLSKINQIITYYNNERTDVESESENPYTGFNYISLQLYNGTTNRCTLMEKGVIIESGDEAAELKPCQTPITDFTNESAELLTTVVLKAAVGGSSTLFKSYSFTLSALDVVRLNNTNIEYYYINDDMKLMVEYVSSIDDHKRGIILTVVDANGEAVNGVTIVNIYCRNNER